MQSEILRRREILLSEVKSRRDHANSNDNGSDTTSAATKKNLR